MHVRQFVEGALQKGALRRLAHHHHRIGAIDGDDRDDAPLHSGFRAARQTLCVFQTLRPGPLTPDGMASSWVDDGCHPIAPCRRPGRIGHGPSAASPPHALGPCHEEQDGERHNRNDHQV